METVIHTRVNPSNPDKKSYITGSVARLSNSELSARSQTSDAAGNPLFHYGPWDSVKKQATVVAARDVASDLDRIKNKRSKSRAAYTASITDRNPTKSTGSSKIGLKPLAPPL